jgi:hypothetical protein
MASWRTDSPGADAFYRSLGFLPVTGEPACSHQLVLIETRIDARLVVD